MSFIEESLKILKENNYKMTSPRKAVLSVLEKSEKSLSAYDIEAQIPKNISVNVVTIYRILDVFEELGIVHRIHTKEGYIKCELGKKKGCHNFAVCKVCGKVYEFLKESCSLEKLVPKNLPFKNLEHISEITGVCNCCNLNANK